MDFQILPQVSKKDCRSFLDFYVTAETLHYFFQDGVGWREGEVNMTRLPSPSVFSVFLG